MIELVECMLLFVYFVVCDCFDMVVIDVICLCLVVFVMCFEIGLWMDIVCMVVGCVYFVVLEDDECCLLFELLCIIVGDDWLYVFVCFMFVFDEVMCDGYVIVIGEWCEGFNVVVVGFVGLLG